MGPFRNFDRVGVLRMIGVLYISSHGLVQFLYRAQCDDFLWPNERQKYIYNNGSFAIFSGLSQDHLLSRCASYAHCAEDALRFISKRGVLESDSI